MKNKLTLLGFIVLLSSLFVVPEITNALEDQKCYDESDNEIACDYGGGLPEAGLYSTYVNSSGTWTGTKSTSVNLGGTVRLHFNDAPNTRVYSQVEGACVYRYEYRNVYSYEYGLSYPYWPEVSTAPTLPIVNLNGSQRAALNDNFYAFETGTHPIGVSTGVYRKVQVSQNRDDSYGTCNDGQSVTTLSEEITSIETSNLSLTVPEYPMSLSVQVIDEQADEPVAGASWSVTYSGNTTSSTQANQNISITAPSNGRTARISVTPPAGYTVKAIQNSAEGYQEIEDIEIDEQGTRDFTIFAPTVNSSTGALTTTSPYFIVWLVPEEVAPTPALTLQVETADGNSYITTYLDKNNESITLPYAERNYGISWSASNVDSCTSRSWMNGANATSGSASGNTSQTLLYTCTTGGDEVETGAITITVEPQTPSTPSLSVWVEKDGNKVAQVTNSNISANPQVSVDTSDQYTIGWSASGGVSGCELVSSRGTLPGSNGSANYTGTTEDVYLVCETATATVRTGEIDIYAATVDSTGGTFILSASEYASYYVEPPQSHGWLEEDGDDWSETFIYSDDEDVIFSISDKAGFSESATVQYGSNSPQSLSFPCNGVSDSGCSGGVSVNDGETVRVYVTYTPTGGRLNLSTNVATTYSLSPSGNQSSTGSLNLTRAFVYTSDANPTVCLANLNEYSAPTFTIDGVPVNAYQTLDNVYTCLSSTVLISGGDTKDVDATYSLAPGGDSCTITVSASPTSITPDGSSTITWSSENVSGTLTPTGQWSGGSAKATSGSQSVAPPATPGTYTYGLSGVTAGGTPCSGSTTVTVNANPTGGTLNLRSNINTTHVVSPYGDQTEVGPLDGGVAKVFTYTSNSSVSVCLFDQDGYNAPVFTINSSSVGSYPGTYQGAPITCVSSTATITGGNTASIEATYSPIQAAGGTINLSSNMHTDYDVYPSGNQSQQGSVSAGGTRTFTYTSNIPEVTVCVDKKSGYTDTFTVNGVSTSDSTGSGGLYACVGIPVSGGVIKNISVTYELIPSACEINLYGPSSVYVNDPFTLTWSSSNAALPLVASGDWSGTYSANGSQSVIASSPGTYEYIMEDSDGDDCSSSNDNEVTVVVTTPPPVESFTISTSDTSMTIEGTTGTSTSRNISISGQNGFSSDVDITFNLPSILQGKGVMSPQTLRMRPGDPVQPIRFILNSRVATGEYRIDINGQAVGTSTTESNDPYLLLKIKNIATSTIEEF